MEHIKYFFKRNIIWPYRNWRDIKNYPVIPPQKVSDTAAVLPRQERRWLEENNVPYEIWAAAHRITKINSYYLIFKNVQLPADKFDHANCDVLFELPGGFPETPLDMFYTLPVIRLQPINKLPYCADVVLRRYPDTRADSPDITDWQRWSRHWRQWKEDADGVHTLHKRMLECLHTAKYDRL